MKNHCFVLKYVDVWENLIKEGGFTIEQNGSE